MINVFYRIQGDTTVVSLGHLVGISRKKKGDRWDKTKGILVALLNLNRFSKHNKRTQTRIAELLQKEGTLVRLSEEEVADVLYARWQYTSAEKSTKRTQSLGVIASEISDPLVEWWRGVLDEAKSTVKTGSD